MTKTRQLWLTYLLAVEFIHQLGGRAWPWYVKEVWPYAKEKLATVPESYWDEEAT
jgi:hypothetical protein